MDQSKTITDAPPVARSAIRKVSIRLVPFVALMFFINYLDRTAIGFAAPNGMNDDLALSAAQFRSNRINPAIVDDAGDADAAADAVGAAPAAKGDVR